MTEVLVYEKIYLTKEEVLLYNGKPLPQPEEENLYNLFRLLDKNGNHIGWRWKKVMGG